MNPVRVLTRPETNMNGSDACVLVQARPLEVAILLVLYGNFQLVEDPIPPWIVNLLQWLARTNCFDGFEPCHRSYRF